MSLADGHFGPESAPDVTSLLPRSGLRKGLGPEPLPAEGRGLAQQVAHRGLAKEDGHPLAHVLPGGMRIAGVRITADRTSEQAPAARRDLVEEPDDVDDRQLLRRTGQQEAAAPAARGPVSYTH